MHANVKSLRRNRVASIMFMTVMLCSLITIVSANIPNDALAQGDPGGGDGSSGGGGGNGGGGGDSSGGGGGGNGGGGGKGGNGGNGGNDSGGSDSSSSGGNSGGPGGGPSGGGSFSGVGEKSATDFNSTEAQAAQQAKGAGGIGGAIGGFFSGVWGGMTSAWGGISSVVERGIGYLGSGFGLFGSEDDEGTTAAGGYADIGAIAQDSHDQSRSGENKTYSGASHTVTREADLRANVTGAQTIGNLTEFHGEVVNTGDATAVPRDDLPSRLISMLHIDYGCDGSVDMEKEFEKSLVLLRPSDASKLYVILSDLEEGHHCYSFDVDTLDVFEESSETNNTSVWYDFTVEDNSHATTEDDTGIDRNNQGYITDPSDNTDSEIIPEIIFEAKTYRRATGTDVQNKTITNWTSDSVTVGVDEELAIRWDATGYELCVPFIKQKKFSTAIEAGAVVGNTEIADIDLTETSGTYSIQCRTEGDTMVTKEISVSVKLQ